MIQSDSKCKDVIKSEIISVIRNKMKKDLRKFWKFPWNFPLAGKIVCHCFIGIWEIPSTIPTGKSNYNTYLLLF